MLWLLGLALAADVDIDDLDHWQQDTDAMLKGPPGCWEFTGGGQVVIALYTPAGMWSRAEEHRSTTTGTFTGVLEDGVWRDVAFVTTEQEGMVETDFEPSFLFGVRDKKKASTSAPSPSSGAADAANFIDRLLDSIDPATTMSYAQWTTDKSMVEFVQHVPLDDSRRPKEVTLRTQFPEGERATAIDALFPRRLNLADLSDEKLPIRVTLMDGQAHLRSQAFDDIVLPGAETMSMVVGLLGYTIGYEQRVVYKTAQKCTAKATDEGTPLAVPVSSDEDPS
ncbi:MAG: hypothetical protein KC912_22010 [Proteobacteria bacterium]|nr:hypothetical protein [Pseudomonadota bacterium]